MELEVREQLEEIHRLKGELEKENIVLRDEIKAEKGFEKVVGDISALNYVLFGIKQVAHNATVLNLGETGSGKSMVANALHEMSPQGEAHDTVNCAALPANLVESELFGPGERGVHRYPCEASRAFRSQTTGRYSLTRSGRCRWRSRQSS